MTMSMDRLRALTEAYGADRRRWPEAERAAVEAAVAEDRSQAERLLREADAVDAVLDASPRPIVSSALRDRVLASALSAGLTPKQARRAWDRLVIWFAAGWAAAACAGVVAGVNLTGHLNADARADAVLTQFQMAAVDDNEVLP